MRLAHSTKDQHACRPQRYRTLQSYNPDYSRQPLTAGQWLEKWKCDRHIWVPNIEGRFSYLDILDIVPALPERGQCADFIVKSAQACEFFICFAKNNRLFKPFSKPTLIIPAYGLNQAWWLLP